jgi:hypothetical protein
MENKQLNWEGANQQAYQALFNLEPQVFSRPLLEYRCGQTRLNRDLPEVVSIDHAQPLPFTDFQFDLALSVYPFFRVQEDPAGMITQLRELIRVAREVRLAPHQLDQEGVSKTLGPLMLTLQQEDVGVEITPLSEQFGLKNAVMLRLWANACRVA